MTSLEKIKNGDDLDALSYTFDFKEESINQEFKPKELINAFKNHPAMLSLEKELLTTIEKKDYEYLLGFYEGITRKTPPLDISFENLKGFYDAIQLVCKVHLKDKK